MRRAACCAVVRNRLERIGIDAKVELAHGYRVFAAVREKERGTAFRPASAIATFPDPVRVLRFSKRVEVEHRRPCGRRIRKRSRRSCAARSHVRGRRPARSCRPRRHELGSRNTVCGLAIFRARVEAGEVRVVLEHAQRLGVFGSNPRHRASTVHVFEPQDTDRSAEAAPGSGRTKSNESSMSVRFMPLHFRHR